MDAMQILVIILSSFLALFLLLAIALTVMLIKLTAQIKQVTATAQNAAEHLASFATNASKFTSPVVLGKLIYNQIKKFKK